MTNTQTIDPRANGFNYGAPLAEPNEPVYQDIKAYADRLRRLSSEASARKSWHLDMLIRDVRHSCSFPEQAKHKAALYRWAENNIPVIVNGRIVMQGDNNIADGGIYRIT